MASDRPLTGELARGSRLMLPVSTQHSGLCAAGNSVIFLWPVLGRVAVPGKPVPRVSSGARSRRRSVRKCRLDRRRPFSCATLAGRDRLRLRIGWAATLESAERPVPKTRCLALQGLGDRPGCPWLASSPGWRIESVAGMRPIGSWRNLQPGRRPEICRARRKASLITALLRQRRIRPAAFVHREGGSPAHGSAPRVGERQISHPAGAAVSLCSNRLDHVGWR